MATQCVDCGRYVPTGVDSDTCDRCYDLALIYEAIGSEGLPFDARVAVARAETKGL